jgi:hypothetical protein
MSISKALGIVALILWLSVATMAYTNTWAKINVTSTSYHTTVDFVPGENFKQNDDGSSGPWMSVWHNESSTNTVDTFPHEQLYQSMYITIIPSVVFSVACFITAESKDEEEEQPEQEAKQ